MSYKLANTNPNKPGVKDDEDHAADKESAYARFRRLLTIDIRAKLAQRFGCVGLTLATLVIFALLFLVPLSSIVVGSIFKDDCSINRKIPIFLIVEGTVLSFLFLLNIIECVYEKSARKITRLLRLLVGLFLLSWLVAGSVWVYEIRKFVSFDYNDTWIYCHHFCYYFAFSAITVRWIFVVCFYFCLCI